MIVYSYCKLIGYYLRVTMTTSTCLLLSVLLSSIWILHDGDASMTVPN